MGKTNFPIRINGARRFKIIQEVFENHSHPDIFQGQVEHTEGWRFHRLDVADNVMRLCDHSLVKFGERPYLGVGCSKLYGI